MPLRAGACVHLPDSSGKAHLAVLLTDPIGNPPRGIFVNFESRDQFCSDQTVILAGGHNFIRHQTAVVYQGTRVERIDKIEKAIADPHNPVNLHHSEPYCSDELLQTLREGLLKSPFTPKKHKAVPKNSLSSRSYLHTARYLPIATAPGVKRRLGKAKVKSKKATPSARQK